MSSTQWNSSFCHLNTNIQYFLEDTMTSTSKWTNECNHKKETYNPFKLLNYYLDLCVIFRKQQTV